MQMGDRLSPVVFCKIPNHDNCNLRSANGYSYSTPYIPGETLVQCGQCDVLPGYAVGNVTHCGVRSNPSCFSSSSPSPTATTLVTGAFNLASYPQIPPITAAVLPQGCQRIDASYSQTAITMDYGYLDLETYYVDDFLMTPIGIWLDCPLICDFDLSCVSFQGGISYYDNVVPQIVITCDL